MMWLNTLDCKHDDRPPENLQKSHTISHKTVEIREKTMIEFENESELESQQVEEKVFFRLEWSSL